MTDFEKNKIIDGADEDSGGQISFHFLTLFIFSLVLFCWFQNRLSLSDFLFLLLFDHVPASLLKFLFLFGQFLLSVCMFVPKVSAGLNIALTVTLKTFWAPSVLVLPVSFLSYPKVMNERPVLLSFSSLSVSSQTFSPAPFLSPRWQYQRSRPYRGRPKPGIPPHLARKSECQQHLPTTSVPPSYYPGCSAVSSSSPCHSAPGITLVHFTFIIKALNIWSSFTTFSWNE